MITAGMELNNIVTILFTYGNDMNTKIFQEDLPILDLKHDLFAEKDNFVIVRIRLLTELMT